MINDDNNMHIGYELLFILLCNIMYFPFVNAKVPNLILRRQLKNLGTYFYYTLSTVIILIYYNLS